MILRLLRRRKPTIEELRLAEHDACRAYYTARRRHEPCERLHRKWCIAKAALIQAGG